MTASTEQSLTDLLKTAKGLAVQIENYSHQVDREGKFPEQSVQLLRDNGLMGVLIPHQYGGADVPLDVLVKLCEVISGACLNTGMIWGMHMQQVAILAEYAEDSLKTRLLPRIARGEVYVVSVTSSHNKTGSGFASESAIQKAGSEIKFERNAPTVTGANYGDGYLLTIREDDNKSNLAFVYAERNQLTMDSEPTWDAMGMRGTQSCKLSLTGTVPKDQFINPPGGFASIAHQTMNPIAHIAWVACWLGAVKAGYFKTLKWLRHPENRQAYDLRSSSLIEKLARIRMKIDTVQTYLQAVTQEYSQYRGLEAVDAKTNTQPFKMRINYLKILGSEMLGEAIDELIQLVGLKYGYLKNETLPLERIFRDMRSSRLMLNNANLLLANGSFALLEKNEY
ncbi:acyl-CoA dehydrogenase family protein [Paenibacillus sp. KS-LC4]|uniref:acyl-CoA dehydrogenase family protein n=1 Tax=Paenibacillus sp. KS-LC4 TaxID=2979727 RepID=UPI0030D0B5A8